MVVVVVVVMMMMMMMMIIIPELCVQNFFGMPPKLLLAI